MDSRNILQKKYRYTIVVTCKLKVLQMSKHVKFSKVQSTTLQERFNVTGVSYTENN